MTFLSTFVDTETKMEDFWLMRFAVVSCPACHTKLIKGHHFLHLYRNSNILFGMNLELNQTFLTIYVWLNIVTH
jgi:hypothetical protein